MKAFYNLECFETSAKTGKNVDKCFEYLGSEIKKRYEFEVQSMKRIVLEDEEDVKPNRKCC